MILDLFFFLRVFWKIIRKMLTKKGNRVPSLLSEIQHILRSVFLKFHNFFQEKQIFWLFLFDKHIFENYSRMCRLFSTLFHIFCLLSCIVCEIIKKIQNFVQIFVGTVREKMKKKFQFSSEGTYLKTLHFLDAHIHFGHLIWRLQSCNYIFSFKKKKT